MEVLQRTANRGSIPTGYDIDNSLKFEADNSEYMSRIMTSTGNRKTFTVSVWLKRTQVSDTGDVYGHTFFQGGNAGTGTSVLFRFGTSTNTDQLRLQFVSDIQVSVTNRVFRDTSAWYHIVVAVDTTQATASDRWKLYVNGVQETSFASSYYPTQNADTQNNYSVSSTYGQDIGAYVSGGTTFGKFNGYMAEYNHIDGQQLLPTDFGEFDEDTGIWKPKAYTGSYGTNGFYLDFENSASLGADGSGNSNNFTLNNITSADQATDTPTNNFATFNVLSNKDAYFYEGASETASNGGWRTVPCSIGVTSGKWYAEVIQKQASTDAFIGVMAYDNYTPTLHLGQSGSYGIGYYAANGQKYVDGTNSGYGNSYSTTDVMGIALDMDNGYVYFSKNGTWQNSGDPTSGATGTGGIALSNVNQIHAIAVSPFDAGATYYIQGNFGGYTTISIASGNTDANGYGNFEYAPPSGYYALCSKNLAEFG